MTTKTKTKDYLIVALDTSSEEEALKLINKLSGHVGYFKVGLELFTSLGPKIIKSIKDKGDKVFFDGKFLDIPNTVSHAVSNMVRHRVDMLNTYMSGGTKMLNDTKKMLVETAKECKLEAPKLLGVTVLTSISNSILQDDLKIKGQINEYVVHLATLAISNNLDGIICSPNEAESINKLRSENVNKGKKFIIVTPGVRPSWANSNDQVRIATPKEAVKNGANHIVVGRPITEAKDPLDAVKKILEEIEEGINN